MWHAIGSQLQKPAGPWGRLAGRAMAVLNAKSNTLTIEALNLQAGETLLELGCGCGYALQAALDMPKLGHVLGLDWSSIMLAQAANRNRDSIKAMRLALVQGDFDRLPLPDDSIDAVLAVNTVYFM